MLSDVNKVKEGICDKLGNAIQYFATFFIAVVMAFFKGWKLTLVILSCSPLLFAASLAFTKLAAVLNVNELKAYGKAGAIAEETLTAIRTVFAFNGSRKALDRYSEKLNTAKKFGIKKGFSTGILVGILWFVIFLLYAIGFWYGWKLSTEEADFNIGNIMAVFFLMLIGVFSLGNGGPYISTAASSRAAAYEIFQIIDRQPEINSSSDSGEKIEAMQGDIEYSQVEFSYPSRPDIPILRGADIRIKAGSTVALVGHSGCGKSTCIQLLQRFYDPVGGAVRIDGVDVKTLNVKWLRGQLGVVSQEPVLFGTSISENIKFGKTDATDAEVVKAAQNANAHDFIMKLPQVGKSLTTFLYSNCAY